MNNHIIKIYVLLIINVDLILPHLLPLVVNTWGFTGATDADVITLHINLAYKAIQSSSPVKSVIAGCSYCERNQCDGTVGFGGSPDEDGRTTLDAMIMDGKTHAAGSVGCLQDIKDAIAVAEAIMLHTKHTLLVGHLATEFAVSMGFKRESLQTQWSKEVWKKWQHNECQPNYWKEVVPDSSSKCGPYKPSAVKHSQSARIEVSKYNHDTIGQIVVDTNSDIAVGTSTNGARHKIAGRVGDSPIIGSGAYANNEVGGAAATGDGDIMMRFLPSFLAVELMRQGHKPTNASQIAIQRITKYYPKFQGAVIATTVDGDYGAACHGLGVFPYSVRNPEMMKTNVIQVKCT